MRFQGKGKYKQKMRRNRIILVIVLLSLSGCTDTARMESGNGEAKSGKEAQEEADPVIEMGYALFREASEAGRMDDLEMCRSIVNRFGDHGYAAVDGRNQIDMAESEQVIRFCGKADAKEEELPFYRGRKEADSGDGFDGGGAGKRRLSEYRSCRRPCFFIKYCRVYRRTV